MKIQTCEGKYKYECDQKSKDPPGPDFQVAALRACLITSFTPFGRSGLVTHATKISFDDDDDDDDDFALPKQGRCQNLVANCQLLGKAVANGEIHCTRGFCDEEEEDRGRQGPHLSIRIGIWILPSDTLFGDDLNCICFDHPNRERETAMLSRQRRNWVFQQLGSL